MRQGAVMAKRTYRPHIRVIKGPRYNSLIGMTDWSAFGIQVWECTGYGSSGCGTTPREAYDAWYREFLLPSQNGSDFMAAYTSTKYPQGIAP